MAGIYLKSSPREIYAVNAYASAQLKNLTVKRQLLGFSLSETSSNRKTGNLSRR